MSLPQDLLPGLQPSDWRPHALHGEACDWPEKNCYADLWVGLLHALGLEPLAMLGFTVAVDFEDDQWTFFKPPLADLRQLYGIDVQELQVWRPLLDHVRTHLAAGALVSTEADAFWLPDTAATDYRRKHTKTTIVISALDEAGRRARYFHNAVFFELAGEDYERLFRLGLPPDPAFMPFYAERIRIARRHADGAAVLAAQALALLRGHLAWRPADNPFERFARRSGEELPRLLEGGLEAFHAWAFAGVRQAGAAFECLAAHLRWLAPQADPALAPAAEAFAEVSRGAKALLMKGARAAHTGRAFDMQAAVGPMAQAWQAGMEVLALRLGGRG
ncbi:MULTISPECIES: DUF1839 family protein [Ramlibacter]|uniref:DUF1839 family protein n=1 Tax=Ramlibacter aquaticus TaxID=2780094 RepID=A0ABR9SG94_9BURK|nr:MULTISPECIES: DUF1839 family protein [Ramlibacter]MBE7941343.1 DUF1839 family protein [Ramlibacter aquaticus]